MEVGQGDGAIPGHGVTLPEQKRNARLSRRRFQEQRGHWPIYSVDRDLNHPADRQAIKASLLGTADATPRPGHDGLIRIWLDHKFVDRLSQMRDPDESYSDVILRLAKASS